MAAAGLVAGLGSSCRALTRRLCQVPSFVSCARKKTSSQQPELPKITRKPLTSYMQFMLHHHTEIRRRNPAFSNEEVRNMLVQMWQKLTFEEKNLWSLKYEREMAEYNRWHKEFAEKVDGPQKSKSPEGNIEEKVTNKLEPVEDFEARKKKDLFMKQKMRKDSYKLGKPKPPGNAFTIFLNLVKQDGGQFKNFLVEGSAMWQKLPEEKKEVFQQKAKEQREKYEADLLEWEAKMYEAGRSDLVRSSHRKQLNQKRVRDKGS